MDGFVYVQTNDAEHNEVVVFGRNGDGTLERLSGYLTGGKGSGEPHLPSQSSVVLDQGRLFVTNAGSDDVTFFAVEGDRLRLVDRVASGGSIPRSIAVHGAHVYVLNTGSEPNVAGFSAEGERLEAVQGSTREAGTDPAQVALDEVLRASHDQAELMRMIGISPEGDGAGQKPGQPAMAGKR